MTVATCNRPMYNNIKAQRSQSLISPKEEEPSAVDMFCTFTCMYVDA